VSTAATSYVSELESMRDFYRTCFGPAVVVFVPGEYCVLQSAAWTLTLVLAPPEDAARIEAPPRRRERTPIKLSFAIDPEGNIMQLRMPA
jgi:hypothetical protein